RAPNNPAHASRKAPGSQVNLRILPQEPRLTPRAPDDYAARALEEATVLTVRVNYHARCFDGLSSASLFTRFYEQCVNKDAKFVYAGLAHRPGNVFPDGTFNGDVNAIVDFRYHHDPRLTWWFDHHQSTFDNPDDEKHFFADRSGKKFFDPKAKSCAKFLAEAV